MTKKILKVCASNKKRSTEDFNAILELPFTMKEINSVIENFKDDQKKIIKYLDLFFEYNADVDSLNESKAYFSVF